MIELGLYNFMRIASGLGVLMLTVGAGFAVGRRRHAASLLQCIGAVMMLSVQMLTLLPTHLESGRIAPAWQWRAEEVFTGLGILIFAAGYLWWWAGMSPNTNAFPPKSTPIA